MSSVLPAILIAAMGLPAQGPAPSPAPGPTPASAGPAPTTSAPPPGPGNVVWPTTPEQARDRAVRESKFVFYEFAKEECGNCQRMDALLYPAFDFEALLVSAVPVKIDLGSMEGKELAERYSIEEAPSVLITTPEGRLVFRMQGFMNQGDFFRHARRGIEEYRTWSKKIESQDIPNLSATEAFESGNELYHRADSPSALPRLKRALTAPGSTPQQREDALELLAAIELDLGRPADSRKTIERLLAVTKDNRRRERAELFRAQIPLAENRPAEALALFRKFQKDHPTSPHLESVNQLVARLQERVGKR